jgi:hypothetical protein
MDSEGPDRLSLRQYSARRKALGLSYSLSVIQGAIKAGRIHRTCPEHPRCPPDCGKGKIDPSTADTEWAAYTDTSRRPDRPTTGTLSDAKTEKELWQARLAKQRFEIQAGVLVRADEVQRALFRRARVARDALLVLPRRLAGQFSIETDPKVIEHAMEAEIREALQGLDKEFRGRKHAR